MREEGLSSHEMLEPACQSVAAHRQARALAPSKIGLRAVQRGCRPDGREDAPVADAGATVAASVAAVAAEADVVSANLMDDQSVLGAVEGAARPPSCP